MAVLGKLLDHTREGGHFTAKGRALRLFALLILLGFGMGILNVPLAASAANSIAVLHSTVAVPTDPQSPLWDSAQELQVPLSAQQMQQPGGGTTTAVYVRAMEDGHTFAIRVSWNDDTRNDTVGSIPSDAAAVQFPIDPVHVPYQCMGQTNSRVNIWQWKATLERQGIDNNVTDPESAGVRNLTSNGICKAVDTPGVLPRVKSYHDGKQWHVVYYRDLSAGDLGTAPITPAVNTSAAFAVWNGARGETKGMKAVSTWNTVLFQTPSPNTAGNILSLAFVVVLAGVVVGWAMRRMSTG